MSGNAGPAELNYKFDPVSGVLKRNYQAPPDYDRLTSSREEICASGLAACRFSYSSGDGIWKQTWSGSSDGVPRLLKVNVLYKGEERAGEWLISIPVGGS